MNKPPLNNTPKNELQERAFLKDIIQMIKASLGEIDSKIRRYAQDIKEQKEYLWENKSGMDHVEKISVRQSVDQSVYTAEAVVDRRRRLQKLLYSPYFGRIDFLREGVELANPIYIGIHTYFDEGTQDSLIHDWRAPISTMFYDFETGPASFDSPAGIVRGDIQLKRQYRIRDSHMEFMIESDLNIHDDILQKELSLASDDKMKNIVATIQRDQNAIIRNEKSDVLIIQGVAGSGKTSIALHRIAFLLYRFKEKIRSKDVLIISPNKVFADFISNVLPELGEEEIPEMGMEDIAKELLSRQFKFQSFFEQVTMLLSSEDTGYQERIKVKADHAFLNKLREYVELMNTTFFKAEDFYVHGKLIPAWFMQERFEAHPQMPIVKKLKKIAHDVEQNVSIYYHYSVTAKERAEIKKTINKMYKVTNLKALYKDFYDWLGRPELFKISKGAVLEYSDVFPMIYLNMRWEGFDPFTDVKHLLVDEMQDYTPLQYDILKTLFGCPKTILGDANQSVNPLSSSRAEGIREVFAKADCVRLLKSYRSTYEITRFAQRISQNEEIEMIERHGKEPETVYFSKHEEEIDYILKSISKFSESEYHSLGLICKTQKQADQLYHDLKKPRQVQLIQMDSEAFKEGVVLCTAHMAKGLEFDSVIVFDVSKDNYHTPIDRGMLFIACTRAMHQLTLTHTGILTNFIK